MSDERSAALGWCDIHQVYHRNFVCQFGGGVDAVPPLAAEIDRLRAERDALRAALDEAETALGDIVQNEENPKRLAIGTLARIRERKEKADG